MRTQYGSRTAVASEIISTQPRVNFARTAMPLAETGECVIRIAGSVICRAWTLIVDRELNAGAWDWSEVTNRSVTVAVH